MEVRSLGLLSTQQLFPIFLFFPPYSRCHLVTLAFFFLLVELITFQNSLRPPAQLPYPWPSTLPEDTSLTVLFAFASKAPRMVDKKEEAALAVF